MTVVTVGHEHAWKYAGRPATAEETVAAGLAVGCEAPYRIACAGCAEVRTVRCGRASARVCSPCSIRSRKRVQRVASSGVVTGVRGLFLTVTAPSWARHFNSAGHECRCTGGGHESLALWNATASKRFNRLMRDLEKWVGRCSGCRALLRAGRRKVRSCELCPSPGGVCRLVYFKGAETQRRGALHFHWLVRRADGQPLRLRESDLRWLALRHGFGHEVDAKPIQDHHAGYVAKYASKAAGDRADVPWDGLARFERLTGADPVTGEVFGDGAPMVTRGWRRSTRATYRTWSRSRAWGDSMRAVRCAQAHHEAVLFELMPWGRGGVRERSTWAAEADACRWRPRESRGGSAQCT